MAEVPEIEIIVRDLCEALIGRTIISAEVLLPDSVLFPSIHEFTATIQDRKLLDANRRAKYILITLSDDMMLSVHFMLWGTLKLVPTAHERVKETLVILHLNDEEDLRFTDKLGYARMALAAPEILTQRLDLDSLGPEALDPAFSVETLAARIVNRRGVLKTHLLNQRVLAGLGNRDADESLWLANIDPRRETATLMPEEIARLHAAIVQVLQEGIALRGSQRDLFGQPGRQSTAATSLSGAVSPARAVVLALLDLALAGGTRTSAQTASTNPIKLEPVFLFSPLYGLCAAISSQVKSAVVQSDGQLRTPEK
jgi:formamidopyrimidine-DNA glycosylase